MTIPKGVTTIGSYAFKRCALTNIAIPNSVQFIGCDAFADNSNLEEAIVPDHEVQLEKEYSSLILFNECKNLKLVKGNTLPYCPDYMASQFESDSPFIKDGIYNRQRSSFTYYVYEKVFSRISDWEKKKEYETSMQWQSRVTEENRQAQVKKVIAELRAEFIKKNIPQRWSASIGTYDADYQTFPVHVTNMNTVYVKVPSSEAQDFKAHWEEVVASPVYDIIDDHIGVVSCSFRYNKKDYALTETYSDNASDMAFNLPPLQLDLNDGKGSTTLAPQQPIQVDNSLDMNIPTNSADNKQTFAVIIGNEKYTQVAQVPYANNDARIFAEYCKKTLGMPEKNVKVYENATYGTMIGAVSDMQKIAKAFKGDINVIFYYAGHGIPDEATGDGYLLPIDADGMNMRVCYPLSQLYKDLGEMQAKSVTCFMDACFSGAQRGNGMVVAARGVAIKAKADHPTGNTVVFTAATDKQTAYPYEEKGHGMFTYYLLKKLRETKGDCTLGELGTYISDEVAKQAVVTNGKEQTPVVLTSVGVAGSWKTMKLK